MEDREIVLNDKFKLQNTYSKLPKAFYSFQLPEIVPSPNLILFNDDLAKELGLDIDFLESEDGVDILSGNKVLEGTNPIAEAYAGHQFGYFTMLGDGRAVLLGEYISNIGERYDIVLKGSGITPYSRGGDGKATLGPMLREYIISEGMNGLRIPTSRSLAVVSTGEKIIREELLPGAILTRIAKSHIRVGTFELAARYCSIEELKALADYTIDRHYKNIAKDKNPYLSLLNEVINKQAQLISKWQLVGFIHGVMNTDNMFISGETLDYGPCAFMDEYDEETVFSSIDKYGRYSYGNQPDIGLWNLSRFAETLLPLLDEDKDRAVEIAKEALKKYKNIYYNNFYYGMRSKLGIYDEKEEDKELINELLDIMSKNKADFTNTFLYLTLDKLDSMDMFKTEEFKKWYIKWKKRISEQKESEEDIINIMQNNNPTIIPRNHLVEEALEAAVKNNDYSVLNKLVKVIKNPYDYDNINFEYTAVPKKCGGKYKTYCGT